MTNAELAILSLVAEGPRHGYEIEQVIEARGMREWTEVGFSSIYYLLKKLERKGWIEGRLEEAKRGPARKVYQPTPAGREALRAALFQALSEPQRCYPPLQLGLANLPAFSPQETVDALRQHGDALAERQAQLQRNLARQQPLPYFVEAMFDHSLTRIEAEKDWIEKLIRRIKEEGYQ